MNTLRISWRLMLVGLTFTVALVPRAETRADEVGPQTTREATTNNASTTQADQILQLQMRNLVEGDPEATRAGLGEALELYRRNKNEHGESKSLLLLGLLEQQQGRQEQALEPFRQAARLLHESGDSLGAWFAFTQAAESHRSLGRYREAQVVLKQALALISELSEPGRGLRLEIPLLVVGVLGTPAIDPSKFEDPFQILKQVLVPIMKMGTLDSLGMVLMAGGCFEEADRQFGLAMRVPTLAGRTLILFHRGQLWRRQLRIPEARTLLGKALDSLSESLPNFPLQLVPQGLFSAAKENTSSLRIQILRELSEVEMLAGRPRAALAFNDRARTSAERFGPLALTEVLEDRIRFLRSSGKIREAMDTLTAEVEASKETPQAGPLRGALFLQRGSLALHTGDFHQALLDLEHAAQFLRTSNNDKQLLETEILTAEAYFLLGQRDLAQEGLEQARELSQKLGNSDPRALAEAIRAMKDPGQRWAGFDSLRTDLQGPRSSARTEQDLSKLKTLVASLDFSKGITLTESSLSATRESAEKAGFRTLVSMTDLALGISAWRRGETGASRSFFRVAAASFESDQSLELAAWSRGIAGLLEAANGNDRHGRRLLEESFKTFEVILREIRFEELLTIYLDHPKRQALLRATVSLLALQGEGKEAFLYSERTRARALLGLLGNQPLRIRGGEDMAKEGTEIEALRRRLSELENPEFHSLSASPAQRQAELDLVRTKYETLLMQIQARDPEFRELVSATGMLRIDALQESHLPPATTLVSYFFTPSLLLIWVIDRDSFAMVPVEMTQDELDSALCFYEAVARPGGSLPSVLEKGGPTRGSASAVPCATPGAESDLLYNKLIAPIRPLLRHPNLMLVPHGPLHYLPFAALKEPTSGRYLVQDFSLSYLPSASVLPFLEKKLSPIEGRALILGAPQRSEPQLVPQEGARLEAQIVGRILGTKPYLGVEATERRLFQEAKNTDLVHLAAHGVVLGERPRFSRIALAPDASNPGVGTADGNLEVHEIFGELDLEGVNLVILSACQTSLGRRTEGEEIIGLTRAFFYAGAPTVVSTLWNIADRASVALVERFYRHLQRGLPAAEALRQAQIQTLSEEGTADPYFWASFTLHGLPSMRWSPKTPKEPRPKLPA